MRGLRMLVPQKHLVESASWCPRPARLRVAAGSAGQHGDREALGGGAQLLSLWTAELVCAIHISERETCARKRSVRRYSERLYRSGDGLGWWSIEPHELAARADRRQDLRQPV